jgi:hypothetical protein
MPMADALGKITRFVKEPKYIGGHLWFSSFLNDREGSTGYRRLVTR